MGVYTICPKSRMPFYFYFFVWGVSQVPFSSAEWSTSWSRNCPKCMLRSVQWSALLSWSFSASLIVPRQTSRGGGRASPDFASLGLSKAVGSCIGKKYILPLFTSYF